MLYIVLSKYFWKFDKDMRETENAFFIETTFSCFMQENSIPFEGSEY